MKHFSEPSLNPSWLIAGYERRSYHSADGGGWYNGNAKLDTLLLQLLFDADDGAAAAAGTSADIVLPTALADAAYQERRFLPPPLLAALPVALTQSASSAAFVAAAVAAGSNPVEDAGNGTIPTGKSLCATNMMKAPPQEAEAAAAAPPSIPGMIITFRNDSSSGCATGNVKSYSHADNEGRFDSLDTLLLQDTLLSQYQSMDSSTARRALRTMKRAMGTQALHARPDNTMAPTAATDAVAAAAVETDTTSPGVVDVGGGIDLTPELSMIAETRAAVATSAAQPPSLEHSESSSDGSSSDLSFLLRDTANGLQVVVSPQQLPLSSSSSSPFLPPPLSRAPTPLSSATNVAAAVIVAAAATTATADDLSIPPEPIPQAEDDEEYSSNGDESDADSDKTDAHDDEEPTKKRKTRTKPNYIPKYKLYLDQLDDENNKIRDTDVLCGRGDRCNKHKGNKWLHELKLEFLRDFPSVTQNEKTAIIKEFVQAALDRGQRFWQKEETKKPNSQVVERWYAESTERIHTKLGRMLYTRSTAEDKQRRADNAAKRAAAGAVEGTNTKAKRTSAPKRKRSNKKMKPTKAQK